MYKHLCVLEVGITKVAYSYLCSSHIPLFSGLFHSKQICPQILPESPFLNSDTLEQVGLDLKCTPLVPILTLSWNFFSESHRWEFQIKWDANCHQLSKKSYTVLKSSCSVPWILGMEDKIVQPGKQDTLLNHLHMKHQQKSNLGR